MNNKFSGMTVNERLYVSGLLPKFDEAVAAKDIERVKRILRDVDITDSKSIDDILRSAKLI